MRGTRGFSLVELMIAVAIVAVLASVALPAFNGYVLRARASEGPGHLQQMYNGILAYWNQERAGTQGIGSSSAGQCIIHECCGGPFQTIPTFPPTSERRTGNWNHPEMAPIGFAPAGPIYQVYGIAVPDMSVHGRCGLSESDFASNLAIIIFGVTDLDGDGTYGGYSLQIGIRDESLFREPGFSNLRSANEAMGLSCAPLCSDNYVE